VRVTSHEGSSPSFGTFADLLFMTLSMLDAITELLDVNLNFSVIFVLIGVYLGFLWTIFSFWVLIDAQKRYQKHIISVPLFLFVLLFNFPALIFYLVTRPDYEETGLFNLVNTPSDNQSHGGVHVPLINFKGDEGVELTLELKVSKKQVERPSDMHINVDWVSTKENLEVVPVTNPNLNTIDVTSNLDTPVKVDSFNNKLANSTKIIFGKAKNISFKRASGKNEGESNTEDQSLPATEKSIDSSNNQQGKKHKSKKRRK
jgi:hypothetical protein